MGGAERWLISLARCCDSRRVEWVGTALALGGIVHPDLCREMSAYMPIYASLEAGALPCHDCIRPCPSALAALQSVLKDADVVITWGVSQLRDLVTGYHRPVILVSHGDGGGEWGRRTIRTSETGALPTLWPCLKPLASLLAPSAATASSLFPTALTWRLAATIPRQEMRRVGLRRPSPADWLRRRYSFDKNPLATASAVNRLGGDYRAVYAGSGWQEAEVRWQVQKIAGSAPALCR